jgi:hypothetical protein
MNQSHLVDRLEDPSPTDLVRLATDQLYAGAETNSGDDEYLAAVTYALVAIAASLDRLATRLAPDLTTLRPARDDR